MSRNSSQHGREVRHGLADLNYTQYLKPLKSKDYRQQLIAAKDFYAFLLNELKKVKRDDETSFVDNLIPTIRELANENNQNITDKQACIYIITSIINLDNINVRVRRRHQTSLFRWLRNLLACSDPTIIHMASRAMGRYAQAGVECDVEFRSGLETLRSEARRYQSILLVRELSLAYPPRLFLNSAAFFENIMLPICDHNPQIRYEAVELFRLSLSICVSREISSQSNAMLNATANTLAGMVSNSSSAALNNLHRIRRTSTSSSFGSLSQDSILLNSNASSNVNTSTQASTNEDKSLSEIKECFKNSLKSLEALISEYSNSAHRGSIMSQLSLTQLQQSQQATREDKLHGYLLIILEVVKFACLDFEKQIEKYLLTYNLYHQRIVHHSSNTVAPIGGNSWNNSSSNGATDINLIENTAHSCEELHAVNMIKLLPQGCFDPLHSNDPFMFLFKRERIHINSESATCKRLVQEKYDRIVKACLGVINVLNLQNINQVNSSSASNMASSMMSGSLSLGASFTSTFTSSGSGTTSSSLGQSNSPPSAYRCIQETILSLLPRLARFNQTQFNALYIDDTLKFLSNLNANTQFFLGSSSSSTQSGIGISSTSSSTSASAPKRSSQQQPSNPTTSTSTPTASSSQQPNQLQMSVIMASSSFCLGTLKSEIMFCMGFMSLALKNSTDKFLSSARQLIESLKNSPLLKSREILRKKHFTEREAQVNELNSIMAFIVMFASSIASNADKAQITESIMGLLEPLMVCSGGVTYTMRYFLNEISLHIPELKLPIHENLLKILAHILTGRQLSQIIQAISHSASHLIQSNNLYSLMSNIGQTGSSVPNVSQPIGSNFPVHQHQEFMPSQMEIESIVQALQTLRAFEFSSLYVIAFLRYCVDFYLAHESRLVKIEATLTTARLLSSLISTLHSQDSRSLISIISCALRKLLICSITDYEPDVRYHVLNSLDNDTRFDMFVSLPENLNILFMCVRDEKVELRELSASMISRLSASNSAYILPFIRKILMQLLTEVDIYPEIGQREKSVRLIGYLLSHAPRLVNLYVKPLIDCLHSKLCEYRHDVPFASSIVTVVGQLASQSSAETIQHFDTVIPFLIESMQDFYYVQLKHTSLWALSQIIANTGYCIDPYKKYPHLLEILLGFLQTETSEQIRRETIRVLGLLGAIDAFEYKKNVLKSKRDDLINAAVTAAQQQQQQLQNQIAAANQNQNGRDQMNAQEMKLPTDNPMVYLQPGVTAAAQAAAIAANLNQNNIIGNNNNNNEQTSLDPIEMLISMNANNSLDEYYPALAIHLIMKTIRNSVSIEVRRDAIQALVFAMRTLDNRCVNYVELVIPPFLDLIKIMNDNLVIDLIVQLGFLVSYIRKHIEPYLNRILNIIEYYWNLPEIQPKMVVALIDLVQSISNVMDIEFKRYLPQILPLILKQLQVEIKDRSCANTSKLLALFRSCTCCLENYIHLILSEFAEYLIMSELKSSNQVKQEILFTIYTFARQLSLSDNCAILFQSFIKILETNVNNLPPPSSTILASNPILTQPISQIIQSTPSTSSAVSSNSSQIQSNQQAALTHHYYPQTSNMHQLPNTPPILSITYLLFSNSNTGSSSLTNDRLSHTTDLATLTLETLYLLARQMGGRFFVFAPMFDRILIRNSNYSKLYEQLMVNCRDASFHTFWTNQNFVSGSNSLNSINSTFQNTASNTGNSSSNETHTPFRSNQQVSFGNLKVCIDRADQLTSREGWRESFRRYMSTVVQETPISTLRACSLIPYETTPPDLFNACFISIWVKISEREQNDLINYMELALRNSFVPETIKMILNLTEFIERCDVGQFLPLDYQLLAEKAFQVRAYAKALHYVEEQFHACMSVSSISNNLGVLFTGVGGVSGAGGGYNNLALSNGSGAGAAANMTTRRMLSNLSAMSRQQQQQTLIYLLEQLVTLNHELQRTEAAMGVLDFASKYLQALDSQTRVKERWYEKLHQWQKALNIYERELKKSGGTQTAVARRGAPPNTAGLNLNQTVIENSAEAFSISNPDDLSESRLDLLMGRMRCLKGLGEWRGLVFSCSDLFQAIETTQRDGGSRTQQMIGSGLNSQLNPSIERIVPINPTATTPSSDQQTMSYLRQLNSQQTQQLKEKVAEMGAAACWGLGDWQQMRTFVDCLPETTYDGALYRCVLGLSSDVSLLSAAIETSNLDNDSQRLCNGQERGSRHIIDLIEKTRDLLDADLTSMATQSYERSYQAIIEAQVLAELEEIVKYKKTPGKRDWLIETWWKRLQGCERSLEYWHRLLLVRSIVLTKQDDIKPWLKFSSLCQKEGHLGLARTILDTLLSTNNEVNARAGGQGSTTPGNISHATSANVNQLFYNTSRNEELCKYAYLKFLYASGDRTNAIDRMCEFSANLAGQYQHFLQHQQQQQINMAQLGGTMTGAALGQQIPQPQIPNAFHMVNTREIQKRRSELEMLLSKCYLKLGHWYQELGTVNIQSIEQIINYFKMSRDHNNTSYKSWQAWAYANYEAIQFYRSNPISQPHVLPVLQSLPVQPTAAGGAQSPPQSPPIQQSIGGNLPPNPNAIPQQQIEINQQRAVYVKHAIKGFLACINLSAVNQESNCLQDTLRLLTLWFDYGNSQEIFDTLSEGIGTTPMEIWLQVIPQLIARIDTNKQLVARLIHSLLTEFGRVHPQALVYRLILASKTSSTLGSTANSYQHYGQNNFEHSTRTTIASRILNSMREHNSTLVEQAKLVSEELIRVAILWHEMWHESLEEASKLHFSEKNTQGMLDLLEGLHNLMDRGATTNKETAFLHAYGRELNEAREFCRRYRVTRNQQAIESAWDKYYSVFKRITKQLPQMTTLELNFVSPRLMTARDLELAVPGTYEPNKPLIRIKAFNANIQVICSKQRPRKISIFGSNGCEYVFLLKGHEDLRQDERVMQIFGLVNNLLLKNHDTARRDLAIQRYSVIPLSQNSGLLEWLLNCDTLHWLIREYRERKRLLLNLEHKIILKLASDYDHLPAIHKVQIFEMAIESTSGNDLAEILWHKSLTAEKWLERRTNYTRSLAVMSMVGYVLGLGDRHPSNLMLDRTNGKIIHVDFGDCFETAMTREKFPEKIPFRLTRMLKNAMEVTGIEGTFRRTCESVMRVLRDNRDSVMAVLEAFVYDPLVYWRLVEATGVNQPAIPPGVPNLVNDNAAIPLNNNLNNHQETEETNRKAIQVLNRVKDKLTGRDFGDESPIDEARQIELLINQATSSENLCQCFIGWCAWW